ncbi:hypothetical protein WR25_08556 [Diploscapter pachys]|uniref:W2 domain-containing protein n=1 Tax=Diploscapter pachys TaxID=2018661 RepID=A0A2A2JLE0_9BILA|nr:hypothetical protein WR25_08556 [Diploscapter pachys]
MRQLRYSPKSYQLGVAYGKRCKVGEHLDLVCAIFGSDCVIEDGCSLHRCIVGSNCKIGKNCILEEICIGNNVQIPDGTKITSRHAVIGHGVSYPPGLECPRNCMISTAQPPEDDMDDFKVREEQGVFIWNMRSGDDLWNGTKRRRRTTSGIESDAQSLNQNVPAGHESADEDPDQIPAAVFFEEVVELMQRVLELEGPEGEDTRMRNAKERMENLKLEINSLRFANNVPWEDVLKLSVLAMLSFQQAHTLNDLKKFFCRWSHFFTSLYKRSDQQVQILTAFETKLKDSSAESPWLSPKAITVLIHYLYELDLLEDDAILIWFDELEHVELKKEMQKIVDWLEESSDEEEKYCKMSFTDFAYFNGSVRRDKAQESVMQTFNAREKFLKKLEEERHMRQVVQRKTNAAVIIQKFYRRNAAMNVIHRQWRQQFDINEASSANNKEILLDRLSRIALFYRHPQDDGRLITICSQTLSFMRTNSIAPVEMMTPRTRLLVLKTVLKFLVKSQKNTNITMPVRFIETFAFLDPESVHRLIKMGYMTAMVSVVVKTSEAMGIGAGADGAFHLEETVPPKLDATLQLLLTPIDKCDKEKRCTVLNSLLSAINENPNQSVAVRVLLAFIRKNIKAKKICFEDFMSAFEFDQSQKLDVFSEQSTSAENIVDRAKAQGKSETMMDLKLTGQKMAWILTEIMTIGEEDGSLQNSAAKVRLLSVISKVVPFALNPSSDFDDKSMETEEKMTQCWLKESIQKRLTLPIFKSMIFSALQQGDSLSLVVGFEKQLSGMIYEISMSEQFIQRLWDSICEVGENSGSGTPMVVFSQFTHVMPTTGRNY